ncbi:MAG TPA: CHAT domain-containing protein [Bacteroidales bacterium]|nr:CHAT domain-containing protein [Bacteroidales bacterium]
MLNSAKYLVICLALLYSEFTVSAETDSHLRYFSILNNDLRPAEARDQFQKALNQAIHSNATPEEILFLKSCFTFSCYNNREFTYEPLLNECIKALEGATNPLKKDLADVYLVIAQYNLFTDGDLDQSLKWLNNATRILKRDYAINNYRFGILSYLKGYLNNKRYNSFAASQFCRQAQKILKEHSSLSSWYYMTSDLLIEALYYYQIENNRIIIEDHRDIVTLIDVLLPEYERNNQSPSALYYYKARMIEDPDQKREIIDKCIRKAEEGSSARLSKILVMANLDKVIYYGYKDQVEKCQQSLNITKTFNKSSLTTEYTYCILALKGYTTKKYRRSLEYCQKALIAGSEGFNDTSIYVNPEPNQIKPFYTMIDVLTSKAFFLTRFNTDDLTNDIYAVEANELALKLMDRFAVDMEHEYEGLSMVDDRKKTLNNTVIYAKYLFDYLRKQEYLERAFYASEKSKMRILLAGTVRDQNMKEAGIPDSLLIKYTKLKNNISQAEHEISLLQKENKKIPYILTERLTGYYNLRDDLNYTLKANYPRYEKLRYNDGSVKIKDIVKYLAPDEAFIEYHLAYTGLYTFLITKDTFLVHHDVIDNTFIKQLNSLRKYIITNPLNQKGDDLRDFIKTSSWLYSYLIAPIYKDISGKRLIIVPGDNLTQIPFEVLLSKPDTSIRNYRDLPYLVKEFPISYAYSSAFLINDNSGDKHGKGMGIFIPDYSKLHNDSLFADLAGARFEASFLKKYKGSRLFKNRNATETAFKKKAPGFNILHIAAHTDIDSIQSGLSCFILDGATDTTDDGRLYSYEINESQLNAHLVVLSGCSTGYGRLMFSEGLVSLARSFFYTGVRTVVFTLWNIADDAGSKISTGFYGQMSEHQSLDIAMRNAKLEYLENADPLKSHPYYWAGYIVLGRTQSIELHKSRHIGWIAGIAGASLLISLVIIMRRKRKISLKAS